MMRTCRYAVLDVHAAILQRAIEDRADAVARSMADVLRAAGAGDTWRTDTPGRACPAVSNGFGIQDWWGVGHAPSVFAAELLESYRRMRVPAPDAPFPSALVGPGWEVVLPPRGRGGSGRGARVEGGLYCEADRWETEVPGEGFGVEAVWGYVSVENIVSVVSALLLERRVVVQCGDPLLLSAITMALPHMIRPYQWQTHYIPFLPPSLADFIYAPVPLIAGVLQAPPAGYESDHIVLIVEQDFVLHAETVPRHPLLTAATGNLLVKHSSVSAPARGAGSSRFPRRLVAPCSAESLAAVKEMVHELALAISSMVSLFEIRGHCVAGRDLVSGDVLTKATKVSFLKTVPQEEVAFMSELLDTQLFAAHLLGLVSLWLSQAALLDPDGELGQNAKSRGAGLETHHASVRQKGGGQAWERERAMLQAKVAALEEELLVMFVPLLLTVRMTSHANVSAHVRLALMLFMHAFVNAIQAVREGLPTLPSEDSLTTMVNANSPHKLEFIGNSDIDVRRGAGAQV